MNDSAESADDWPAPYVDPVGSRQRWSGPPCPPRPSWFDVAACKGQTALFFHVNPGGRGRPSAEMATAALALCASCPAVVPCREYGREHRMHGIWGGETEVDRSAAGFVPDGAASRLWDVRARARRDGRSSMREL